MEENTSSFADDADTHCDFSLVDNTSDTAKCKWYTYMFHAKISRHSLTRKHVYRDTFGNAHIQYHDFDNQDSLTFRDKYTAL